MAFCQKEYVFSHIITKDSRAHQPALFQLDLRDLIQPLGECSPMFVIDSMSVTAYKQAGTDKMPFHRSLTVYDEDNRQAMLNLLTFMTTEGLRASDDAKGSLDLLGAQCSNKDFVVDCERCGIESSARVVGSDTGNPTLRLCLCTDGCVSCPRRADAQREAQTHRSLIRLLRCAYRDNLDVICKAAWFTDSVGCDRLYADDPDRISIPFQLMDFIVSFYRTLSEYADNFAVVHSKAPHVKVLIESPSENMGYVTGSVTVTLLYGTSVLDVCYNMSAVRGARRGRGIGSRSGGGSARVRHVDQKVPAEVQAGPTGHVAQRLVCLSSRRDQRCGARLRRAFSPLKTDVLIVCFGVNVRRRRETKLNKVSGGGCH
ncbi:hypothetical protein Q5P01_019987 [Channa striata]|uniref:Uncharacterized protein n=1 Tax=Channa striata TaxID=64152 RepID=A0AA88S1B7_CHASR|nr:hypothetical protein Q5P01_019987 [Channa striata]